MRKKGKGRDDAIAKFTLGANDAAIVFRHNGAHFVYPSVESNPPEELLDTLDFLRYALARQDWLAEWMEQLEWDQALADDTTETAPRLELIPGGLACEPVEPERGPFAPPPDGEE